MAISNNEYIFQLQRAQRIGLKSETVQAVLQVGQQKAVFDKWSTDLDTANIIGAVCYLPALNGEKSVLGNYLLTRQNAAPGVLHLSHSNKDTLEIPLRLLQTDFKTLVYVPIEPITGLDNKQSYIMFSEVATVAGVIELTFITA